MIQEAINSAIATLPRTLLGELLREKLAIQGVRLSRHQCAALAAKAIDDKLDAIPLPWWRFWQYERFRRPKNLLIEFTPEDAQKVTSALQYFSDNELPEIIESTIQNQPSNVLQSLQGRWNKELKSQLRQERGFRKRMRSRWGVPIEKLRMLLTIAREFGSEIATTVRDADHETEAYLSDVLTRLHARACQITSEIECLLSSGYADGAMARWRSLHEVAVVSLFIAKHGATCAEAYSMHQVVESHKAANNYRRCQHRLGYSPLHQADYQQIEVQYNSVREKYGAKFVEQYGWARAYLPLGTNARVNFSDIEENAGLDHWRAHYQMASHNVHANPKGIFFKLGLIAELDILLAGPSNAGLTDPGHASALSLVQASSALMAVDPTLDNIVIVKVLNMLAEQIGTDFLAASERLHKDHAKFSGDLQ